MCCSCMHMEKLTGVTTLTIHVKKHWTIQSVLNNILGVGFFSLSTMEWLCRCLSVSSYIFWVYTAFMHSSRPCNKMKQTQRRRGKKWRGTICTFRGVPDSSFVRPNFTPTFGFYKKTKNLTNIFMINSYFLFPEFN